MQQFRKHLHLQFLWLCLCVCLLPSGASASDLVLQCTPEGIRLQCYMSYYTEEMKTVWKHKYDLHIYIPHEQDSNIYSDSWDVTTFCSSRALFCDSHDIMNLYFNSETYWGHWQHLHTRWYLEFDKCIVPNIRYMWGTPAFFCTPFSTQLDFFRPVACKNPHFWLDFATQLLSNVVINMSDYHSADVFKKVVERLREGGCLYGRNKSTTAGILRIILC